MEPQFLTLEEVREIRQQLVEIYSGTPGVRDRRREFGVLPGFDGELFAAGHGELIDRGPVVLRSHVPGAVDSAV